VNLNSVLIGTDNAPRLVEYYKMVLGEPTFSDESYATWVLGNGAVSIGAHSEVHGSNDQPGRVIWNIETEDVKGDFARMQSAGAIVVREPYSFDGYPDTWIATLADPDGNYFQLMTPMDPSMMEG
jgi:predicted enzyme related to lactoylglutathione lyase